jgi:hypothetical protein
VDRARARISGWLAALWQPAQWDVVDDDNGEPIADLFACSRCGASDAPYRHYLYDVPLCAQCDQDIYDEDHDELRDEEPWSPPERQVIHAIQVQGVYLPLTSAPPLDDTVTDWAPRTCARREARARLWQPPGRDWVQQAVGALTSEHWPVIA